ncbi:MAG: glycosyl hydrolase 115 family protein [Bacteroidota bacterium]
MKTILLAAIVFVVSFSATSQPVISGTKTKQAFPIVAKGTAATLYIDKHDYTVIAKTAKMFQQDIASVTGISPALVYKLPVAKNIIVAGTIDHSELITKLVASKKLNLTSINGKWEAYKICVIEQPFAGVEKALVIAGSDRRGTAYGLLELSRQMGVSPWIYWADVPAKKSAELYYNGGTMQDAPAVKYRGIFINDEAPALSGWSKKTFGGFNHKFYEKVFELILRMKGNYLWPAMWGSAFNDDDSLNPKLADDYAIVMGTSHHEPLVRAHDEWRRYGTGKWNFDSNATALREFWRKGIQRMGARENIVSVGMRGDGDEPMTRETATGLLERIVKDQREIIADVTKKDAASIPQLWALYKEVQDYYDKGMRVPDDVTLLLCDDNWGNIRKLPKLTDKPRTGGYGIYYHFDYVGGPRNYKWINTNQIERTWEQMHLAYEYGVNKIWIVNVGDIKPMEFPTQFFLDYAWNPSKINAEDLPGYYTSWAQEQFGKQHAFIIGKIVAVHTKFNSRRKPELLSPATYSLTNYEEAEQVVSEYNALLKTTDSIYNILAPELKDAYYQLVLHPVQASANLNELYVTVAKNRQYAKQQLALANIMADKAKALYVKDSMVTNYYNDTLAKGKWSHMMDQTHIGYTYWQQPAVNSMPALQYVNEKELVDSVSAGNNSDTNQTRDRTVNTLAENGVFQMKEGYISMEAEHYTKVVNTPAAYWQTIPNAGRTLSAVTIFPVTTNAVKPGASSPHLQYAINLKDTGFIDVRVYLSPTLMFHNKGLQYAVSIDDDSPQIINMHEGYNDRLWNQWVSDNIVIKSSNHFIKKPGEHLLKFWMVDAGILLQKIVISTGNLQPSYLGPPESAK